MAIISFTNYKRGQTTGCMSAVVRYTADFYFSLPLPPELKICNIVYEFQCRSTRKHIVLDGIFQGICITLKYR